MGILVSIITVAYNSENTIRDTIESVLNQTYTNIEYIIVDGLSKDHTFEIAKSYQNKFIQKGIAYTIKSEKDNGIYDAMNKGIKISQGEIIGIINSDDWYEQDTIEKVVESFKNTKFDYFFGDLRLINGKKTKIKHAKYTKHYVSSRNWNHPTSFVAEEYMIIFFSKIKHYTMTLTFT
jgi:glycosyltransferase involved in cell wall biosynthesis